MLGRTDIHIHKLTVQSTTAQIKKESEKKRKKEKAKMFNLLFIFGSIDVYSFV
jgi:hypothetical protein